jgi:hypothetical protein
MLNLTVLLEGLAEEPIPARPTRVGVDQTASVYMRVGAEASKLFLPALRRSSKRRAPLLPRSIQETTSGLSVA